MKNKPISWFALWKRLGNQPLGKTKHEYVKCYINNEMWHCRLVFYHSGSDFYLEPIRRAERE